MANTTLSAHRTVYVNDAKTKAPVASFPNLYDFCTAYDWKLEEAAIALYVHGQIRLEFDTLIAKQNA